MLIVAPLAAVDVSRLFLRDHAPVPQPGRDFRFGGWTERERTARVLRALPRNLCAVSGYVRYFAAHTAFRRAALTPEFPWDFLERAKGFEPSTPTLARLCSTPELHPLRAGPAGQTGGSPTCGNYRVNATKWYSFSLYSAIFSKASLLSYRREWPDAPIFSRLDVILQKRLGSAEEIFGWVYDLISPGPSRRLWFPCMEE
jgi:hypothetical protein